MSFYVDIGVPEERMLADVSASPMRRLSQVFATIEAAIAEAERIVDHSDRPHEGVVYRIVDEVGNLIDQGAVIGDEISD